MSFVTPTELQHHILRLLVYLPGERGTRAELREALDVSQRSGFDGAYEGLQEQGMVEFLYVRGIAGARLTDKGRTYINNEGSARLAL